MVNKNSIQLSPELNYLHNFQHRNGTPLKSQWIISHIDERACFLHSYTSGWIDDDTGWGLHFHEQIVDYLGLSHDRERRLFIAKFVANRRPSYWHGYPADYQVNIQDIPREDVLNKWLADEIFSPAKISKILRGKACRI